MELNPQKKLVTQIALEDLERRRALIAPQVDANIEEVLRICEKRLKEAGEPPEVKNQNEYWDAEFNFWHKLISEEVERFRFNGGYEPIRFQLYPISEKGAPPFLGEAQVGHVKFRVNARWILDANGIEVLQVEILKK